MSDGEMDLAPSTAGELATLVGEATTGLRIRGAGSWLQAGRPVQAGRTLSMERFTGVHAYVPEDLTISVGAATTLAELEAVTAERGQCCPLFSWGDDRGTVGATIATATAGPFAAAWGHPRDLVLGLECVDGLGRIVQAGGRVVKNVAGFDLTRLMTGAWGTLGVITRVHLRLRARPTADETLVLRGDSSAIGKRLRGPLVPAAAFALTPTVGTALGLPADGRWLIRLAGHPAAVAAARAAFLGTVPGEIVDTAIWKRVRIQAAPPERASQWRWDALSRRVKHQFDPRGVLNPGLLGEMS